MVTRESFCAARHLAVARVSNEPCSEVLPDGANARCTQPCSTCLATSSAPVHIAHTTDVGTGLFALRWDADGAAARRSHVVSDESPDTESSAHAECRSPQKSSSRSSSAGRRRLAPPCAFSPHCPPAAMSAAPMRLYSVFAAI